MKASFLFVIVCVLQVQTLFAQKAIDYTIEVRAFVSDTPAAIRLEWTNIMKGIEYTLYRKNKGAQSWGKAIATLPSTINVYTDTNVVRGNSYEYFIQRRYAGNATRLANGYIEAGIQKKINTRHNTILILEDETYSVPLANEINTLVLDLIKDGWAVKRLPFSRQTPAPVIKATIQTVYNECLSTAPLSTLFILGHIAVPYSGGFFAEEGKVYPPDGHAEHAGAWSTDMYYGSLVDSIWTDTEVNDTTPVRIQNKNVPGDGKFDLMYMGSYPITLETGRVDLTDMPAFNLNDTELTRRYLEKLHAYKTAQTPVYRAGLIDDNFGVADGEAFASSAWNDFITFFGDSVLEGDYVTETRAHPYLFTYGCGFGNYTTCFDVVNTNQFANDSIQQIFTLLFGSYFGDWDSQNNLLRAALASKAGGLASMWSGRPYWRLHHMALGATIGYSTLLTQNNSFNSTHTPSGYADNIYGQFININLMGDPTLRLHMRQPMPAIKATATSDSMAITVSWPTMEGVAGYRVSKTTTLENGFFASIDLPATDTTWTDERPYFGFTKYMVRPIYLEHTPSGSYYHTDLGAIDSAYSKNMVGLNEKVSATKPQVTLFPNPNDGNFTLSFNEATPAWIEITDVQGRQVFAKTCTESSENLNLGELSKGCYFVKIKTGEQLTVKKLIIH